ncbi:unknown [Peptostreptococcus anaerobius CAG:621]|uniref:hypothetical protein n=1 Tax=Peptostreptococcus anaerobius TaxID=1261 RepID=UPI000339B426|nr:hypothetical protein [Peptostreptococcus anaerobius]CCY47833.1 unknown [Peptostreptococcus anaerobius CAG:621]
MEEITRTYPCTDMYIIPNDTNKFIDHNLEIKVIGIKEIYVPSLKETFHTFLCCDNQGNIFEEFQDNIEEVYYTYKDYRTRIDSLGRLYDLHYI